jgi:hypothetical protein
LALRPKLSEASDKAGWRLTASVVCRARSVQEFLEQLPVFHTEKARKAKMHKE